jgi:hypothetical protein
MPRLLDKAAKGSLGIGASCVKKHAEALGRTRYKVKRNVEIPAAWLLACIADEANVATRVQQADPRPRILSTPLEYGGAGLSYVS